MPLSARAQELSDLYAAIIARGKGERVTSAGQKGRQVAFADTSLEDMIKLYRTLWTKPLGDETGLPLLSELGSGTGSRGLIRIRPIPGG